MSFDCAARRRVISRGCVPHRAALARGGKKAKNCKIHTHANSDCISSCLPTKNKKIAAVAKTSRSASYIRRGNPITLSFKRLAQIDPYKLLPSCSTWNSRQLRRGRSNSVQKMHFGTRSNSVHSGIHFGTYHFRQRLYTAYIICDFRYMVQFGTCPFRYIQFPSFFQCQMKAPMEKWTKSTFYSATVNEMSNRKMD